MLATFKRFWYLLFCSWVTGECAVNGFESGRRVLCAVGRPLGNGRIMISRVYWCDSAKPVKPGDLFDLWIRG